MRTVFSRYATLILASGLAFAPYAPAAAEPAHGIAMYGEPALPPDFVSLPYVNADAPKGGQIVVGEVGSFDSLNPLIRKGRVPWQLRFLGYESLMGQSWDEPFTLYGLLAESVEVGEDGSWVEFTIREEARFSDNSPVTVEDVIWSYETLGTIGHPRYLNAWTKVDSITASGPRSVRLEFNVEDRELALIMGLRPILKAAQWEGKDFAESGLEDIPIATSPYVIDDFEAGRFVSLKRNPDYWGKDLNFRRGTHNIDEVRMEFFLDGDVMFEAFKAGELSSMRETNAAKWETNYNFPRVEAGDVVKSIIPHERPSGMTGLVMNTRQPVFQDWRVRAAMIHAFNFELTNQALNGGTEPRITSYFSNSVLGMAEGPARGKVLELLEPFADTLLPGALEGYALPVSDGSERNRANIAKAMALLEEAGWTPQDGVMANAAGEPLTFEILLKQGSSEVDAVVDIYVQALERLGITPTVTTTDGAQYEERTTNYDFGMAWYRWGLSLSPGNEQYSYWGAEGVEAPGGRNWAGINDPAVEAMIGAMLTSASRQDYVSAVRALDRALTAGRYTIPVWFSPYSRLAHNKELKYADTLPAYGDWIGFQPDVWWVEQE